MSKILKFKFLVLSFGLFLALSLPSWAVGPDCLSLLERVSQSTEADWDFHHGSTKAILAGNLALLTAADAVLVATGRPGFNTAFLTNTIADTTITMVGHQIALRKLPKWLKKWVDKKGEFWLRSATNTAVDTGIIVLFWNLGVRATGGSIDGNEVMYAAAFAGSIHTVLQYVRTKLFLELPKKLDRKTSKTLNELDSESYLLVYNKAKEHAVELGLSEEESESRYFTMLDNVFLDIPYQERLSEELFENSKLSKIISKIQKAQKEGNEKKVSKLRAGLISQLIKIYEAEGSETRKLIQEILYVGEPFKLEESFELQKVLSHRRSRNKWIVGTGVTIDRTIGGAAGIFLRWMTGAALD